MTCLISTWVFSQRYMKTLAHLFVLGYKLSVNRMGHQADTTCGLIFLKNTLLYTCVLHACFLVWSRKLGTNLGIGIITMTVLPKDHRCSYSYFHFNRNHCWLQLIYYGAIYWWGVLCKQFVMSRLVSWCHWPWYIAVIPHSKLISYLIAV